MERRKDIQTLKAESGILYKEAKTQKDIFNSIKTTHAQAATATKFVVKTATVET